MNACQVIPANEAMREHANGPSLPDRIAVDSELCTFNQVSTPYPLAPACMMQIEWLLEYRIVLRDVYSDVPRREGIETDEWRL